MSLTTRRTTHRLTIDAPADLIFTVLRDSSHWPYLDGLTVYSERVSGDDSDHELRTSVVANGSLNSSHCHRVFDAKEHRAEFRQLGVEPPLLSLGGGWAVHRVIDEYSRRELEALRLSCERLALLLRQHSTMGAAGTNAKEA